MNRKDVAALKEAAAAARANLPKVELFGQSSSNVRPGHTELIVSSREGAFNANTDAILDVVRKALIDAGYSVI
jgi:hypothetical protein